MHIFGEQREALAVAAAGRILGRRLAGDLLPRIEKEAIAPVIHQRGQARHREGIVVHVVEDIRRLHAAVPTADLIIAGKTRDQRRLPFQLEWNQLTLPAGEIERETMREVLRIDLIKTDLQIDGVADIGLDARAPLAHRMVEPVIAIHIAGSRAAEGEVFEIAGNDVEIGTRIHPPEFDIDRLVENILREGKLRQAPDVAAAVDLLHLHQAVQPRRVHEIGAEALGDIGLDRAAVVADELAQIGQRFEIQLARARGGLVIAAGRIPRTLEGAFDLKLPTLVLELGPRAVPVAGQSGLERCVVGKGSAAREERRRAAQKKSASDDSHGSANATTWSLIFGVSSGFPPALNTTYCLPL